MARMKILNNVEREAFEAPPHFNAAERKKFFAVTSGLLSLIETLRNPTTRVCLIITAGYFKAQRRFFGKQFRPADIEYVAKQLGVNADEIKLQLYDRQTISRHQSLVLSHFGVSPFDEKGKEFLRKEIAQMVRVQVRPKVVFVESVELLSRKKIAIPSYFTLSTMISEAISKRQKELVQIVDRDLTKKQKGKLEQLLVKELETDKRYPLTLLKKPLSSMRPKKIRGKLDELKSLLALYLDLKPLVKALDLNGESIRYYAYFVIKSKIPQVTRRTSQSQYLYLIMFIVYQTFKLHDSLIDTLLAGVQAAVNAAGKEHKEVYYQGRELRSRSFAKLATALRSNFSDTISRIKGILADYRMSASDKVLAIDVLVNSPEPKQKRTEQELDDLTSDLSLVHEGKDYYDLLEDQSLKLQNRVADIVRTVQFSPDCSRPALLRAIEHYQKRSGNVDKHAPVDFLDAQQQAALLSKGRKFRVSLYKALLFVEIAESIRSGALNLIHSDKYRSLEEYLIPKEDWSAKRGEYLRRAELEKFSDCAQTLQDLEAALDESFKAANEGLQNGENSFLKFRKDGSFHVSTPKLDEVECLPLSSFFPERKYISILEALATVSLASGFLSEFEHWQTGTRQKRPHPKVFFAGIIGYGCDIGHRKLAQISKQLNENELENTVNWYFSLANVQAANDRVLQFMDRMALPNVYRDKSQLLHTSSDGQKFEVAVDSLNANYSFKYLGKEKGVSVVSFVDMRQMLWHSTVISSAEREAAYVIDGLMHNDVIKSDIHSTDTHGYSEVIFGSTFLLSFTFAPRIKGVGRQVLYSFKSRKDYELKGYQLLPSRYIHKDIIVQQWDDILRFIATIRLKVTTASQLFKRLNSYSKQNPLYQGLKEFGKIPKTSFILRYVSDPEFRQAIEKQLNKVEGSHRLSKAVSFGHANEFIQSEKEDQEIAEGCRRLIKNVLICWNYLYLNQLLVRADANKRKEIIEALQHGFIMIWRHYNLHGEFDFSDDRMADSVGLASPKILAMARSKFWEVAN
jgi:TnpA family transposase